MAEPVIYDRFETGLFKRGRTTWGLTVPARLRELLSLDDITEGLVIEAQEGADFFVVRRTRKPQSGRAR